MAARGHLSGLFDAAPDRVARYVSVGELHQAFNFDFLEAPWDPAVLRRIIDASLTAAAAVGAPPTWVLSNHDRRRHVTRFGSVRRARAAVPADARPARQRLPVSGRGARPAGGPGPAGRGAGRPAVVPLRRRRTRPGRLPGAAALVRRRAAVRLRAGRLLAAAAGGLGRADGGRAARRPALDAAPLQGGPAAAPPRHHAALAGRTRRRAAVRDGDHPGRGEPERDGGEDRGAGHPAAEQQRDGRRTTTGHDSLVGVQNS